MSLFWNILSLFRLKKETGLFVDLGSMKIQHEEPEKGLPNNF